MDFSKTYQISQKRIYQRWKQKKYTRIKVPYKYQQTVKKLSKNQNIVIMKQNKDRGVVQVKIPRELSNDTRKG